YRIAAPGSRCVIEGERILLSVQTIGMFLQFFINDIEVPVQVCGKLRSVLKISADADKDTILAAAKADAKVLPYLEGKTVVKEIFVPGKMVNLIVK
ncbi:MAG: hypothetical protein IIV79_04535, partial [Clostridia bacterium]|nr:hypothetical protein [Clostridia bacterium]